MDAAVAVKIGGSLAAHPKKLRDLCSKLDELSKKHRLIVVPGGGEFADTVRKLDKRFSLTPPTAHRMAILGMDQYGLLLSNLMPHSICVNTLNDVWAALDSDKLPILLPSTLLFADSALETSWDVTSDSITAYVAGQLHLSRVILITDVDGIFTEDPKKHHEAKLIETLSPNELLRLDKRTSVDKFLPKMLLRHRIECIVVNGLHPQRVDAVLNGKETFCTVISDAPVVPKSKPYK